MGAGHRYDGSGVCIFCNGCSDVTCCPEASGPCDRNVVATLSTTADLLLSRMRDEGRIPPA